MPITRPLDILHTESSMGWGGQERRIVAEARGFIERGHTVHIAAEPDARILHEAPAHGVPVLPAAIGRRNWRGFTAARQLLQTRQFDIVNTHSSTDAWLCTLAARLISRSRRPALVRSRHVSTPASKDPFTRWLYRHGPRRIVTTGQALRQSLIEQLHLPGEMIVSVPTGIDITRFSPADNARQAAARKTLGLPVDRPIIGVVAVLRSWKGHTVLIDALAQLVDHPSRWQAVFIGDGPIRDVVEQHIVSRGLGERIILAGEQRNVPDWLATLDLFILPSTANEGVPQSVLQALAAGLPVVGSRVGGIPEALGDGAVGRLVEPADPDALAHAITELLDDPAARDAFGQAARRAAEEHWRFDTMIDRMEQVFLAALT